MVELLLDRREEGRALRLYEFQPPTEEELEEEMDGMRDLLRTCKQVRRAQKARADSTLSHHRARARFGGANPWELLRRGEEGRGAERSGGEGRGGERSGAA